MGVSHPGAPKCALPHRPTPALGSKEAAHAEQWLALIDLNDVVAPIELVQLRYEVAAMT
jgi:hypothetical protein